MFKLLEVFLHRCVTIKQIHERLRSVRTFSKSDFALSSSLCSLSYFMHFGSVTFPTLDNCYSLFIYMRLSLPSTQNNKNATNEHVNTSKAFALHVSTMCVSGSANVQYGHVTDNKLSRQSLLGRTARP